MPLLFPVKPQTVKMVLLALGEGEPRFRTVIIIKVRVTVSGLPQRLHSQSNLPFTAKTRAQLALVANMT